MVEQKELRLYGVPSETMHMVSDLWKAEPKMGYTMAVYVATICRIGLEQRMMEGEWRYADQLAMEDERMGYDVGVTDRFLAFGLKKAGIDEKPVDFLERMEEVLFRLSLRELGVTA